ncbi:MAG: YgjP-like metallopeptidase domain-containing protein, partial [Eubacterium sp.]
MNIKIIRSKRKTVSLSVDDDLNAVVRAPFGTTDIVINEFVNCNKEWLEKAVERKKSQLEKTNLSEEDVEVLRKLAKELIPQRVEYYSS